MTIGALPFDIDVSKIFSLSFPYLHFGLVFAIPPPKPLAMFDRLFIPFSYAVWFNISSLFIIGLVVIVMLKSMASIAPHRRAFVVGSQSRVPFLNMINICLGGGSIASMSSRNFARALLMVWLLGSLVLRNAYLGSLFDVLHSGKTGRAIQTFDDLIDANYTLYMKPKYFYLFDTFPRAQPLYGSLNICADYLIN